ncbi:MAG TPA: hypothetical protein DET40_21820 [Lentisphaeria bacterium]|nr:MAG: hypothetical protein A2X45_14155 [Lentisphaerae bacterium GWF2_50_93]HCE46192.1 hypothetical protein [Lentisphaeria bacterium]
MRIVDRVETTGYIIQSFQDLSLEYNMLYINGIAASLAAPEASKGAGVPSLRKIDAFPIRC